MSKKKIGLFCVFFSMLHISLICQENRTIDGHGNNLANQEWGAVDAMMPRLTSANYADGVSQINDAELPNPREISNKIFSQTNLIDNNLVLSDYVWAFGQFLDHDISLVENGHEHMAIQLPEDEELFTNPIPVSRSKYMNGSGVTEPRVYLNGVTSFIDASMVYGSDIERANWLRKNDGSGKLKMSHNGKFLPSNTISGEYDASEIDLNAPEMADDTRSNTLLFVAGDVRANENPLLLTLHTLFVMEHNRMCDILKDKHSNWTGDQLYERARKYIGAFIQSITYNEWLPSMGIDLPPYSGYKDYVQPTINNLFSAAAFRIGHTLINSDIVRMDDNGSISAGGNMTLGETFFNPSQLITSGSIEPFIKGMATQKQQEMDCKVIDDLRNFLFGEVGLDLVAINIFRGRERGLPSYNEIRQQIGLPIINDFIEITNDEDSANLLTEVYGSVENLDPWVGFLAEEHMNGKLFGKTINKLLKDQFQALREGDRFYFEADPAFSPSDMEGIRNTTLRDIIMRNTGISIMQPNVFEAMDHDDIPGGPQLGNFQLEANVFPNPITSASVLKVYAEFDSPLVISVFNTAGLIVKEIFYDLHVGENIIDLEIDDDFIRGVYTISLNSGDDYNAIKVVKE